MRCRAEAEARRAEASKLLAIAQLQLETDPTEALAYTTAGLELADTQEARLFALRALWEAPPAFELPSGVEANSQLAFSPNGNRLVTYGFSDEMEVFSAEGGPSLILSGHGTTSGYSHRAKWLSDDLLATMIRNEGRARIWSLPGGELVRELQETGPAYWMDRDGDLMTEVVETEAETGHALYHLRRWHLPEGEVEELGTVDLTVLGPRLRAMELLRSRRPRMGLPERQQGVLPHSTSGFGCRRSQGRCSRDRTVACEILIPFGVE